jgi:hypothetical protein
MPSRAALLDGLLPGDTFKLEQRNVCHLPGKKRRGAGEKTKTTSRRLFTTRANTGGAHAVQWQLPG